MQCAFALPLILCSVFLLWEVVSKVRNARTPECERRCRIKHDHVTEETKMDRSKEIRIRTWKLCLILLFVMYPTLVLKMFGVFHCREIEGTWYLERDVTLQCYDSAWTIRAVIGGIGVIIYAIGIPVLFFVMLRQNKDNLEDAETVSMMGFLYTGYASYFWLGELVEMTRKMVLSGLIIFIAPGSVMQIVTAGFFCAMMLTIQITCNPFEEEAENKVNQWTLWGTAVTILFGLLIVMSKGDCISDQDSRDVKMLAHMILLVNLVVVVMILWWTLMLLKSEVEGHAELITEIVVAPKELKEDPELKEEENALEYKSDPGVDVKMTSFNEPETVSRPPLMTEEEQLLEYLQTAFDGVDLNQTGVLTDVGDLLFICYQVVSKMNYVVWPHLIQEKAEAHNLELSKTPQGFQMDFNDVLEWFQVEIQPNSKQSFTKVREVKKAVDTNNEWL
jgi:drug/metabolite transporter (DMT)-like permease